jgi:energy-coupling factor transporter transmembrane protein EcfT
MTVCGVIAVVTARLRGWEDWSFLIFVVSFYALPVFVLWDTIVFNMFPPRKFEAVPSPFQTLGINKG